MNFVMKTIPLEKGFEQYVQLEYDILCKIDHPFIMNLAEVYFDQKSLHLIVPLYEGGELFKHVQ